MDFELNIGDYFKHSYKNNEESALFKVVEKRCRGYYHNGTPACFTYKFEIWAPIMKRWVSSSFRGHDWYLEELKSQGELEILSIEEANLLKVILAL